MNNKVAGPTLRALIAANMGRILSQRGARVPGDLGDPGRSGVFHEDINGVRVTTTNHVKVIEAGVESRLTWDIVHPQWTLKFTERRQLDDATGRQWLSFVDPKGIRNLDLNDPKLGLPTEVKAREVELGDPDLVLNAFILSFTDYADLLNVGSAGSKPALESRHVLFMGDGRDRYLPKMFEKIFSQGTVAA